MITFTKPYPKQHETWMDIILDGDTYSACYLTDIANDMIDAALIMLNDRLPFVLEVDADTNGKHYMFVNGRLVRNFVATDGITLKSYPQIDPIKLAKYIYQYLEENKEAYYGWFSFEDDEEEIAEYRKKFDTGLEKLKAAIVQYEM